MQNFKKSLPIQSFEHKHNFWGGESNIFLSTDHPKLKIKMCKHFLNKPQDFPNSVKGWGKIPPSKRG